jgi:hypothetical protein
MAGVLRQGWRSDHLLEPATMIVTVEAVRALVAELRAEIERTEAVAHAGAAHARTLASGDTRAHLFESISERLESATRGP